MIQVVRFLLAVVKAVVFEWSAQPTFLGAILVFELVAAAIQAGMDSVVILLRIKASKAVSERVSERVSE